MEQGPLVLVSGKDPSLTGGHESYVRAHALAAARMGLEPHLFCFDRRSSIEEVPFGVLHRVAGPPRCTAPRLIQSPLPTLVPCLARAAARFLAEAKGPRLIHSFGFFAAAGVMARATLARRGMPAVALASAYATRAYEIEAMQAGIRPYHGAADRLRYRAWLSWVRHVDDSVERWGYARSRMVLVNYGSVETLLVGSYGPRLPLRRIPYCSPAAFESDFGAAPPGRASTERPMIVSVSRHDPRKGVDLLVLALHRLHEAGIPFRACLIGRGKLLEAHRSLVHRLGLSGQVSLPGAVGDPGRYLRDADVFVLPSLAESSGSVSVLEALQSGTAVVASACDGLPEDLRHEVDALLVPPGDVAALARALGKLLADRSLRDRLAAAARRTYEERFSAERFVAALGRVYAELASEASAPVRQDRIASAT